MRGGRKRSDPSHCFLLSVLSVSLSKSSICFFFTSSLALQVVYRGTFLLCSFTVIPAFRAWGLLIPAQRDAASARAPRPVLGLNRLGVSHICRSFLSFLSLCTQYPLRSRIPCYPADLTSAGALFRFPARALRQPFTYGRRCGYRRTLPSLVRPLPSPIRRTIPQPSSRRPRRLGLRSPAARACWSMRSGILAVRSCALTTPDVGVVGRGTGH